jgi:hypothetical protein
MARPDRWHRENPYRCRRRFARPAPGGRAPIGAALPLGVGEARGRPGPTLSFARRARQLSDSRPRALRTGSAAPGDAARELSVLRGRLGQHGGQANRCNHRRDRRRANGHGLRSGFEPTHNCPNRHGAGDPCEQQRGWHRCAHAPLRSTRRHASRRGGSVRSLVPRPTRSTPPSPGIPMPRRSAVTLGRAHQGAHGQPARPR